MDIQVPIGINSDGSDFCISINQSHTFISYCFDKQFIGLIEKVIFGIHVNSNRASINVAQPFSLIDEDCGKSGVKLPHEWIVETIPVAAIFKDIYREFYRRSKKKKIDFTNIFVIVKNIWDVVIVAQKSKTRVRQFLQLLFNAPSFGIIFIFGSVISLRGLLAQLSEGNEKLLKEYVPKATVVHHGMNVMGDEIVINTDNIIFYRPKLSMEYIGLY